MLSKKFKELDSSNMFDHIYHFPEQIEEAIELGGKIQLKNDYSSVQNVCFSGMGGSAIGGDILTVLTNGLLKIPSTVSRNYLLRNWIRENSLVFLLSYSGNTEETLHCLDDALERHSMVAGITSGGKLYQRLLEQNADVITIPAGFPPRASLGYLSVPVLYFLSKSGLISNPMENHLIRSVKLLKDWRDQFCKAEKNNPTFQIANQIYDSLPIIYGEADRTAIIAKRWRTQLEENGKMVAIHHALPEMNHNEIVGYENNPGLLKKITLVWLQDRDDFPRTAKRRKLSQEIIGDMTRYQINVESYGESELERMFYLVYMGDWVSFWVACLHETDPTPVKKINRLKLSLSE